MTPQFKLTLPGLLLLLLVTLAMLYGCSSQPSLPTPGPLIPPLPPQFRASMEVTPSECLPTCLNGLTRERTLWKSLLTPAASPGKAASVPTTP